MSTVFTAFPLPPNPGDTSFTPHPLLPPPIGHFPKFGLDAPLGENVLFGNLKVKEVRVKDETLRNLG